MKINQELRKCIMFPTKKEKKNLFFIFFFFLFFFFIQMRKLRIFLLNNARFFILCANCAALTLSLLLCSEQRHPCEWDDQEVVRERAACRAVSARPAAQHVHPRHGRPVRGLTGAATRGTDHTKVSLTLDL